MNPSKKISVLFAHLTVCFLLVGINSATGQVIELNENIILPEHYVVTSATGEITIDGEAKEKAWENAAFTEPFIDIEGEKPVKFETRVKMLWDETFLYVYAELEEPHIWGDLTKRDAIIYYNNDFEVFLDPTGDGFNYGEIEINPLGTEFDLFLDKTYRVGGKALIPWDIPGLKTAVHINGSLNNPSDVDESWSVEMAIPLAPFVYLKNKPKNTPVEGEVWRINFSRVQWDHDIREGKYSRKKENGRFLREYNWVWSNQGEINMHAPEHWGYLQFTKATLSDNVKIIRDEDEAVKQVLFALFRQTRTKKLESFLTNEIYNTQEFTVKYGQDSLPVSFLKTQIGFEYTATSPLTEKTYAINEEGRLKNIKQPTEKPFVFASWAHGGGNFDPVAWNEKLTNYQELGISEILVGGSPDFLTQLVPLASEYDIRVHAWMWTLNRPNDTIANKHPEWYAVNRAGKNSLEYRAYVDYYQWLSPFHPEAREHIKNNVRKLLTVEGLASVHLDYVRYVDVILGRELQPKYNLVQDREMPEYDYGYHPLAIAGFKEQFGYSPLDLDHPELSTEWRQYRLNAITSLVNEIVAMAHNKNQKITAAVFPFPEMSRQMVRQAWNDWHLDAAYPMLYQNFYQESVDWIGFAAQQGVNDVDFPIYAGLYSPALQDPADLEKAILLAQKSGAQGISIFTADNLSDEQKAVFKKLKATINNQQKP